IPSPPLPVPSLPLPLPSPTHTSPTYAEAVLGYKSTRIQLRAASPPLFEVGECSTVAAARQPRDMAAIELVNLRDAQDNCATLRDEMGTLRRYLSSVCTTHEQERVEAHQALDRSKAHNKALEARIAVLET
ncbi:hypothetical protein Tco_0245041, partial [Tanacetum coccineum]